MSAKSHRLRKMFVTGIFFLIPIGITWWVLNFLVDRVQGYARPMVESAVHWFPYSRDLTIPDYVITVVSLVSMLLVILLIGALANVYFGKKILELVDRILLRLPLIRNIYGGTKQIIEAFSLQRAGSFKKVVLLEYPKQDSWVLGFVTNEQIEEARTMFDRDLVAIFVPSTPNPTTGFLLYLDPHDIYIVDIDVEQAVKLIVSAGMVVPPNPAKKPRSLAENLGLPPQARIEPEPADLSEPTDLGLHP